jgi:hypothetical protein
VILLQALFQGAQHLAFVLLLGHVDEIDDDDAAEVAQPQLAHDGLGRFQVGLEDGFFQVAMPHVGAGVHVDGGHGLGLVDDHVATGLELHLAIQGLLDLILHPIEIEQGVRRDSIRCVRAARG